MIQDFNNSVEKSQHLEMCFQTLGKVSRGTRTLDFQSFTGRSLQNQQKGNERDTEERAANNVSNRFQPQPNTPPVTSKGITKKRRNRFSKS